MKASETARNAAPIIGGLLALVLVWAVAIGWMWSATDPLTALVLVGFVPFAIAALGYLLSKASLEMMAFALPGLLIFFKQNDALIPYFGGLPINDMLGLAVMIWLLGRLSKADVADTFKSSSFLFLTILGLIGAFVVSWINAVELHESKRETLTFIKDLIFALLLSLSIRSPKDLKAFVGWLILSTTFTALTMLLEVGVGRPIFPDRILETWQNEFRSGGASFESVPFVATMIIIGIFASVSLAIRRPQARLILTAAAAIGIAAVLVSITRSAILALGFTTAFMLWRMRKEPFFPLAATIAAVGGVIVLVSLPASVLEKFDALTNTNADPTLARRVDYVKIGADLFQQTPLLGVGAGNYPPRYASDDYRFVRALATERRDLHNLYIQYAVEIGILGALFFYSKMAIMGLMIWRGTKSANRLLQQYSEAMLIGYFVVAVQLVFLASKSFLGIWILLAAAVAIARLRLRERRQMAAIEAHRPTPL